MSDLREKVKSLRTDYDFGSLDENKIPKNPIALFQNWFQEAMDKKLIEANAFTLSTTDGVEVNSRILLCRNIGEEGLSFYTNYNSKKASHMNINSNVAVNFFWPDLQRQLRIQGRVEKLSKDESDNYFASRPRLSQIGAWASAQSQTLDQRQTLEELVKEYEQKFEGTEIPRPDHWGGYLVRPNYFEFWQGRPSRLHDRISYEKENENWKIQRLNP